MLWLEAVTETNRFDEKVMSDWGKKKKDSPGVKVDTRLFDHFFAQAGGK